MSLETNDNNFVREISLANMLEARERRFFRQQDLRSHYPHNTMICFTMNIAGPVKNSPLIRRGFLHGCALLRQQMMRIRRKFTYEILFNEVTGNEGYFLIDLPPLEIKRLTAELEDQDAIGRLFDMDVINENGRKLDREELGLPERTCLLCGQPAKICARSRTHTVAQLQEETSRMLSAFFRTYDLESLARDACRALLYEVCTTPKPGLVDRVNTGSHSDMDIFTFMDSAAALQPYFRHCGEIGMDTRTREPSETFRQIRLAGMAAERDMLRVTHGVNTHKGAIFSMGIVCAALGRMNHAQWSSPEAVLSECGRIADGIMKTDFQKKTHTEEAGAPARTTGEKLFLQYGIRGVRGQAEDGFPAVLHAGLPALERELSRGADINRAGSVALLELLCADTDTNLVARSDLQTQKEVTEQIRCLLAETPSPDEAAIADLDRQFIEKNLSPGGSADLLGLCYLLHFLKEARE